MKAAGWIDRVKAAKGWDSDYRVAKELGLTRSTVSFHRKGHSTLDEDSGSPVSDDGRGLKRLQHPARPPLPSVRPSVMTGVD